MSFYRSRTEFSPAECSEPLISISAAKQRKSTLKWNVPFIFNINVSRTVYIDEISYYIHKAHKTDILKMKLLE